MIEKLMSLNHFTYKKPFSGSDKGNTFHYVIQMTQNEESRALTATCWHGTGNSLVTPEENKTREEFEFSDDGYDALLAWLNEQSGREDK